MLPPKRKRQRISKACNFCRHRKIKCNGLCPCSNCEKAGNESCIYSDNSNKSAKLTRLEKSKSLEDRLDRVEHLIQELSNKVNLDYDKYRIENDNNDSPSGFKGGSILETPIQNKAVNVGNFNAKSTTQKLNLENFSGTHFNICRLSSTFIESWRHLVPQSHYKYVAVLENMRNMFLESVKSFETSWIEIPTFDANQKTQLLDGAFPADFKFVNDLLEDYYVQNVLATCVCRVGEIKTLFEFYYENCNSNGQTRKLKEPELLIMNMALTISFDVLLEKLQRSSAEEVGEIVCASKTLSLLDLKILRDEYFANASFFYHRVIFINEGIQTIKALLLSLVYAEYTISSSRVDQSLLYLVIQYSRDIELQEVESLNSDTETKIWWLVEYFDVEMAFRKGRPPQITTTNNISSSLRNNITPLLSFDTNESFQQIFRNFTTYLSNVRQDTYMKVFNALFASFNDLQETLDSLNSEMYTLSLMFTPECRPLWPGEQNFNVNKLMSIVGDLNLSKAQHFGLLVCYFSFYSHLMVLNSIPSIYTIPLDVDPNHKCFEYETISTNSTKAILQISTIINRNAISEASMNAINHHVSSAFLNLLHKCVRYPLLIETHENCNLLFNVAHNFLITHHKMNSGIAPSLTKQTKLELLCVVALHVGTSIIENATQMEYTEYASRIGQHFNDLEKSFPAIFGQPISPNGISHLFKTSTNSVISNNNNSDSRTTPMPATKEISSFKNIFAPSYTFSVAGMSSNIAIDGMRASHSLWNEITSHSGKYSPRNINDIPINPNFGI